MMYNALYCRQSIDKKDSISIESQLEYCRYEAHGEACLEYIDRGFSGKNTNRPDFERMMQDIQKGMIQRVIVYKLDRISRSILDFANMMEIFQTFHVEFISSTEKFDTSTPIGRAMLNICIVFAQLERETIQKRVTDTYYSRSKKGYYMGGRIPYGFRLTKTIINHIQTSKYEEILEESKQIKLIYSLYANRQNSLNDVISYLEAHKLVHCRGSRWNSARLSEILRNPIYVKADRSIYTFFKNRGAILFNAPEDYTGCNACYLYRGMQSSKKNQKNLCKSEVVLAPHQGIVSSDIWLACQLKNIDGPSSFHSRKVKNSWLSGKIKCDRCGYSLVIRKSHTLHERYFLCSSTRSLPACSGTLCTIYADVIEEYLSSCIIQKITRLQQIVSDHGLCERKQIEDYSKQLLCIEQKITNLIQRLSEANVLLMQYMNEKIAALHTEKSTLQKQLSHIAESPALCFPPLNIPSDFNWNRLSFEDQRIIADLFIDTISVSDNIVKIIWKF